MSGSERAVSSGIVDYRLAWDVNGIGEVRRREECFTTLQSGHLLYHYKANNGRAGVGFLINKKCKDHIVRVNNIGPREAEFVLCMTKCYKRKMDMHQRHHTQKKT